MDVPLFEIGPYFWLNEKLNFGFVFMNTNLSLSNLTPLSQSEPQKLRSETVSETANIDLEKEAIRSSAHDFEAAFLTQMLTFSGLGKALTVGGGEAVSAFTGFYIESLAEKITEAGGLGLADKFYQDLLQTSGLEDQETPNE